MFGWNRRQGRVRVRVRIEYMKGGVSRMKSKLKDNFLPGSTITLP